MINIVVGIVDNVRGAESMERSSVRLSVPSQRREAGLLLSAPRAGVIDRQQEPGHLAARRSAANAGSTTVTGELSSVVSAAV